MQQRLDFSQEFRIARLHDCDVRGASEHLAAFLKLVLANEPKYPGIGAWLNAKVLPGLLSEQRTAYIVYLNGTPVASAVAKRGEAAKFCHLRIDEGARDAHLGDLFFVLMTLDIWGRAKEVHFTLPEGLWEEKRPFFNSFGFAGASSSPQQYRKDEHELRCSASIESVMGAARDKIPRLVHLFKTNGCRLDNRIVLSIHPRYADSILAGKKTVEIRKRFSSQWIGQRLSLYATKPSRGIVGEATIGNVEAGSPRKIWDEHGKDTGCDKADFDRYTRNAREVFAISLTDVTGYERPIALERMSGILGTRLTPPQSYAAPKGKKPWAEAVTIASLLAGRFPGTFRL